MSGLQARGVARSGGMHGVPRGLRRLLIVGFVLLLMLLGLADAVAQRKPRAGGAPRKATEEQPAADASKTPPASTGTTEPSRAAPPKGAPEPPRTGTKPSQEPRPNGPVTTTTAAPGSEPAPPATAPPPTGPAPAVGRRFLASLPPAPVTQDMVDIERFFAEDEGAALFADDVERCRKLDDRRL